MKDVTKYIPQGLGLSLTNNTNLYGGKVILEKNVNIFKYHPISSYNKEQKEKTRKGNKKTQKKYTKKNKSKKKK